MSTPLSSSAASEGNKRQAPLPRLINRAQELDVPILKVEHDTLTTVAVIEKAFGHVRLHEAVKATYASRLVAEHCCFDPLFELLGLG